MAQVLSSTSDAEAIVDRGGVVVVPTETVYGLACKPSAEGVERIFEIKRRPAEKTIQLLLPDATWIALVAVLTPEALALTDAFWPGPLTLVLRAGPDAPPALVRGGTIGVRVPAHPAALDLLARCGPLAASSANLSGEPTPTTVQAIVELFGDLVDAYIDGGEIAATTAGSTVLDLTSSPKILRDGPLERSAIEAVLGDG